MNFFISHSCCASSLPKNEPWVRFYFFVFDTSLNFVGTRRQCVRPETLDVGAQVIQPVVLDQIEPMISSGLDGDQLRGREDFQVLGRGRPAGSPVDLPPTGQRSGAALAVPQKCACGLDLPAL